MMVGRIIINFFEIPTLADCNTFNGNSFTFILLSESVFITLNIIIASITFLVIGPMVYNEGDNGKVSTRTLEYYSDFSNLHSFITQIPDKYNTEIGENGIKIFGGQQQKIT
ncbi:hypothetical protein [Staphylococcus hyicus]|uniref:hypothetical protein n=2 Tax=Staphylococcus TaxID=1279 RepID=UPI00208F9226|nr:hypothetical protein [Staphylococcus hyicus]MCO4330234.1 hypothetical protein [Staphylococcus hyicus]MCO4332741.1 hypothetical protein [Staphylococcus hyicus]MCO4335147.1 hypothetical protein [Staphylococcus hyicus]MCO4337412.1 hypothetical protein [Staphylococcus hyicus]